MNKTQQAHLLNLANWASRFQEQKNSGLNVKVWCAQNNISIHTYNYWKHLVKQEYLESVLPPDVPEIVDISKAHSKTVSDSLNIHLPACSNNSHEWNNLSESSDSCDSNYIKIELPGIYIKFDFSVSVDKVIQILKAVRYA